MKDENLKAVNHMSVGSNRTFGGWKLVWTDANDQTKIKSISEAVAMALIANGMPLQG